MGGRSARLLPGRPSTARALDADWIGGGSGRSATGVIHLALAPQHDRHPLHGVHLKDRPGLGRQHHASRL